PRSPLVVSPFEFPPCNHDAALLGKAVPVTARAGRRVTMTRVAADRASLERSRAAPGGHEAVTLPRHPAGRPRLCPRLDDVAGHSLASPRDVPRRDTGSTGRHQRRGPAGFGAHSATPQHREVTMTDRRLPTEAEVYGWIRDRSNWGRWGPDDQL